MSKKKKKKKSRLTGAEVRGSAGDGVAGNPLAVSCMDQRDTRLQQQQHPGLHLQLNPYFTPDTHRAAVWLLLSGKEK